MSPVRPTLALVFAALAGCRGAEEPAFVRFEPVPESSGFRFRHELPGGRLDNLPKSVMGGLAVFDADGDGRLDVYCVNGGWHPELAGSPRPAAVAPNRLFRNLGGMRFEDVTRAAGVGDEGFGLGACVGDSDGDGAIDLFVSNYGRSVLYRNRGDGTFEDATDAAGIAPGNHAGACFLDYDRDGDLDLFVAQYVDVAEEDPRVTGHSMPGFPGPTAYRGQPSRLYRNRGDGTFEDVTAAAGIHVPGRAMGVVASDVDDDGWIDLVVANDAMPNHVWRNRGDGTFVESAAVLGLAFGADGEDRASMGVTAADVDGDGRVDYLMPDTRGGAAYVWRSGRLSDRAAELALSGALVGLVGWTDVVLDADCDGRLDIYKTHGDLRTLRPQPSFLLLNDGEGRFRRLVAPEGPAAAAEFGGAARGGVAADLDDDGLEDLVVLVLDGKARIFRNATRGAGNWARLRLVGTGGNRLALGARIRARVGGRPVVREVSGSTGYVSAGDLRQHFGLGAEDELEDVRVRWPTGEERSYGDLPPGDHSLTFDF